MHVYWVDERAVPPTHERSNYGQAKKALLDPAGIPEASIHRMRGEASDLATAASDYEAELRETVKAKLGGLPSLDLLVMGIGDDGHTASLFPGDRTMYVTDKLVAAVPATADREARLTLTTPMLENARVERRHRARQGASTPRSSASGRRTATSTRRPGRVIRNFRGSICWVIDRSRRRYGLSRRLRPGASWPRRRRARR